MPFRTFSLLVSNALKEEHEFMRQESCLHINNTQKLLWSILGHHLNIHENRAMFHLDDMVVWLFVLIYVLLIPFNKIQKEWGQEVHVHLVMRELGFLLSIQWEVMEICAFNVENPFQILTTNLCSFQVSIFIKLSKFLN